MDPTYHPATMTIGPGVPTKVHLGLAICFTVMYSLTFFLILSQLLLILYYKHRRLSYQTFFLFSCLFWAALRTTLFSFYFRNCGLSNQLPTFWRWFLFALPVYLQYNMLSILVFYFVLVVIKVVSPLKLKVLKRRVFLVVLLSNIVFLTTNISSSILYCINPEASYQQSLTLTRVIVDYSMFLAAALILCYCIIKLTRQSSAKMLLEGQGVSFCQAIAVCTIIAFLYFSRAVYNIIAVSPVRMPTFNYGWINVSDQGEVGFDGKIQHTTEDYAFISFGSILALWELLPTFVTVWFFRVRKPDGTVSSTTMKSDSYHTSKSYFFDNLDRYNSDENLSIAYTPPRSGMRGSLPDIPNFSSPPRLNRVLNRERTSINKTVNSYGSTPWYDSYNSRGSYSSPHVRGTTPPMLFNKTADTNGLYKNKNFSPIS